jgi:hypothetical protein
MEASTWVCTSVANLEIDKKEGQNGPHKRGKEDILCFNIFRTSVLYEELRVLFPEPGSTLRGSR